MITKGRAGLNEGFTWSEALNKRHAPPSDNINFQPVRYR
jgi:hypothetical protein